MPCAPCALLYAIIRATAWKKQGQKWKRTSHGLALTLWKKRGKIIPKLVYKRIFTLEKERRREGRWKNEKKLVEYRGNIRCYVLHVNSGEVEKRKKKKRIISSLYYDFQHSYYSICILSNDPLLINTNFTRLYIANVLFPPVAPVSDYTCKWWMRNGTRFRSKRDYDGEFCMGFIKLVSE